MNMTAPENAPTSTSASLPPRRAVLAGALGLAAAAAAGGAWLYRQQRTPAANAAPDPLWDIALPQPDGHMLALRQWHGRPLIVNFWATWCAPCVQELPLLNAFSQAHADWQVVGLAVDTPQNVARFMARFALTFPVAIAGAAGVQLSQTLGNNGSGLPFTLMADASGAIRATKAGQIHSHDLDNWRQLA